MARRLLISFGILALFATAGILSFDRVLHRVVGWQLEKSGLSDADEVTASSSLKLWPLHLRVEAEVVGPTIALDQALLERSEGKSSFLARKGLFSWQLRVVGGELHGEIGVSGTLSQGRATELEMSIEMEEVDQALVMSVAHQLALDLESPWKLQAGRISGSGKLVVPSVGLPYLAGAFNLVDVRAADKLHRRKLEIPSAALVFRRDASAQAREGCSFAHRLAQGGVGTLRLFSPATISQKGSWSVEGVTGGLVLHGLDVVMALGGHLHYREQACPIQIAGRTSLRERPDLSLTMTWEEASASFDMSALDPLRSEVRIELDRVGHRESTLLQAVAGDLFTPCQYISLDEGELSAALVATVYRGHISHLEVETFTTEGLAFAYTPLALDGVVAKASGSFGADVTADRFFTSIGGRVEVKGAEMSLSGLQLSEMDGELVFEKSLLREAQVAGRCNELWAKASMGRMSPRISLALTGPTGSFTSILPKLVDEPLAMEAELWIKGAKLQIEGACIVGGQTRLPFGLALSPHEMPGRLTTRDPGLILVKPWARVLFELIGYPAQPLAPLETVHRKLVPQGLCIESGWLAGTGLDADTYIRPLLKGSENFTMEGRIDLVAELKQDRVEVTYEATTLALEHRRFRIDVPEIHQGRHTWILGSGKQLGSIPITAGTYWEKKSDLRFEDCLCHVEIEDEIFDVTEIETQCQGVAFEGSVLVDTSVHEETHIVIHSPKFAGNLSDGRAILAKIAPLSLWELPLDGDALSVDQGLELRIELSEAAAEIDAKVSATITDASWKVGGIGLTGGSCRLDYTQEGRRVELRDLQAGLAIADRSYQLVGRQLAIGGFPLGGAQLHLQLFDGDSEIACLKGAIERPAPGIQRLLLDEEHSFFGALRPTLTTCELTDWHPRLVEAALQIGDKGEASLSCDGEKWEVEAHGMKATLLPQLIDGQLCAQVVAAEGKLAATHVRSQVPFQLVLGRGGEVRCSGLQAMVLPDGAPAALITLENGSWGLGDRQWKVDGMHFDIPTATLAWTADLLTPWLGAGARETLRGCKEQGSLGGRLTADSGGWQLILEPGRYQVGKTQLSTRACTLKGDGESFSVSGTTLHGNHDYHLAYQRGANLRQLVVSSPATPKEELFVTLDEDDRPTQVAGLLHGVTAQLRCIPSVEEGLTLEGTIDIDAARASTLMPEGLQSLMWRTRAGKGYRLAGRFDLPRDDWGAFSFDGHLLGRDFVFYDYRLQDLEAELTIAPGSFSLRGLKANDPACYLAIDELRGQRNEAMEWSFEMPSLTIQRLRPSGLKRVDGKPTRPRTLLFTEIEVRDLKGDHSGMTSWTGSGSLSFVNPPRRSPVGTLFEIPDQILGRLGLDPASLVPSVGDVTFDIHDARIYLTRLEEVYSRGRRSQFFLTTDPSTIDFDGRVNCHLWAKQNNLILKITEIFTLGVGGTIAKPSYRLERGAPIRRLTASDVVS